jgi:membrane protease YdiL (CAAX protease family)
VGLLVRLFLLALMLSTPVIIAIPKSSRPARYVGIALAQLLAEGAIVYYGYRRTGADLRQVFPLRWPTRPQVVGMLLQSGGALSFSVGLVALVLTVWPSTAAWRAANERIVGGDGSLAAAFVLVVLLGPLFEELLFRGVILHGFLRNYSRGRAIALSALLFATVHLDARKFLPVLVGGLVLGWWRVESGSLWPGLIGHSAMNALAVGTHEIARRRPDHVKAALPEVPFSLAACAVGSALLAFGAWLMVRSRVRQETPAMPPTPL